MELSRLNFFSTLVTCLCCERSGEFLNMIEHDCTPTHSEPILSQNEISKSCTNESPSKTLLCYAKKGRKSFHARDEAIKSSSEEKA